MSVLILAGWWSFCFRHTRTFFFLFCLALYFLSMHVKTTCQWTKSRSGAKSLISIAEGAEGLHFLLRRFKRYANECHYQYENLSSVKFISNLISNHHHLSPSCKWRFVELSLIFLKLFWWTLRSFLGILFL